MLNPRHAETYQAALRHLQAGALGSAETGFRAVVQAHPGFAEARFNLGVVLRARRRLQGAARCFREAIRIDPTLAEAHAALGAVLQRQGEEAQAETHVRDALRIRPGLWVARLLLADLLRAQNRLDEARGAYEAMVRERPDKPAARFGLAQIDLLEGRLASGWLNYEFRPARLQSLQEPALQPQWRGEDLAGRTLLVHAEQGFGDSLQFLRFVPDLIARGARVRLAVPAVLADLARSLEGEAEIVAPTAQLPAFDFSCPLPSLPLRLGVDLGAIPRAQGYLRADAGRAAAWRSRIGGSAGPTVAIAWAGAPDHPNDHNRSLAAADVAPLLARPVRWVSLQRGGTEALARWRRRSQILDLSEEVRDFADTAAILEAVDLVLTFDTALCHLAGVLGRPAWVLLPFAPDWRWMTGRSDSPWYASLRLFRQGAERRWAPAVSAVADALDNRFALRRSASTPPGG